MSELLRWKNKDGTKWYEYIATLYFTRKFTIDIDQHDDCRRLFNFKFLPFVVETSLPVIENILSFVIVYMAINRCGEYE